MALPLALFSLLSDLYQMNRPMPVKNFVACICNLFINL